MVKKKQDISDIKKDIKLRFSLIYVLVLLFAILIVIKIFYIQLFEKSKWTEKALTYSQKDIILEPNRGDIISADGRLLATSVPNYRVYMDLKSKALKKEVFNKNVDSLALCMHKLFKDKSKDAYATELKNARAKGERFYLIKTKVSYPVLKIMKTFPIFRLGRYKGGFIYNQENERIQPHKELASRTIGNLNKGEEGNTVGIEGGFDAILRGIQGIKLMQKLSGGVWMPLNDGNEIEPEDGKDIVSTIDIRFQDIAEHILKKQLLKHDAEHGCCILMEVATGDIKAIANLGKNKDGQYDEVFNFAIGESTEPGSTFKLASIIVAMEDGYINNNDTINTGKGKVSYNNYTITDTKEGGHGTITVQEAFEVSSNVAITKIINKYYRKNPKKFIDRIYNMNLGDKLGININGEEKPYIKFPGDKLWSGVSLVAMSIGYELTLAPIQTLAFYNAIANNGKMVKPKFVKAIQQHGEVIKSYETEVLNSSICSKSTITKVKQMLLGVVERGTAKNIRTSHYKIAGKTGTAQLAIGTTGYKGKNKEVRYLSSFVGYFPADKPKYSMIVVVNSPSKELYYGNVVAGPVFREIADRIYAMDYDFHPDCEVTFSNQKAFTEIPISKDGNKKDLNNVFKFLNIPIANKNELTSEWVNTTEKKKQIVFKTKNIKKGVVPNVEGMGARDAIYILEKLGLRVEIQGRGTIQKQSISPGNSISKGDKIVLELG